MNPAASSKSRVAASDHLTVRATWPSAGQTPPRRGCAPPRHPGGHDRSSGARRCGAVAWGATLFERHLLRQTVSLYPEIALRPPIGSFAGSDRRRFLISSARSAGGRSEEHTSELQSLAYLV